jgi:hypothetical protein
MAEAVDAAARLWAAVLEHKTERTVEEARFRFASDRSAAEARWHAWLNRSLGIEQLAAKEQREVERWQERADACFLELQFPASADDVIQRIMGAPNSQGDARASRAYNFSLVWLKWALAAEKQRWEFIRSNPLRIPSEGEVVNAALREQEAARKEGKTVPGWPYEGEQGIARLRKDVEALKRKFLKEEEDQFRAEQQRLEHHSENLRGLMLNRAEAGIWFRLWKEHKASEARGLGGEVTKERHSKERAVKKTKESKNLV